MRLNYYSLKYQITLLYCLLNFQLQTGGRLETILHIQKKKTHQFSRGFYSTKNLKQNDTYTGFIQDELSNKLKEICES